MKSLFQSLQQHPDIAAWQVTHRRSQTQELYMVGNQVDAFRSGHVRKTNVLIHTDQGDTIGENRFAFEGECSEPMEWVQAAVERAQLVRNSPYQLSPPYILNQDIPNPVFDTEIARHTREKLRESREIVEVLGERLPGKVRLSFFEMFLSHHQKELQNHLGLSLQSESTGCMVDMALLTPDGNHEVYVHIKRNRLTDLALPELLEEEALNVLEIASATTLETGKYRVILAGEALDTLFDYFLGHLSGEALYQGYSAFQDGKPVLDREFPFTLRSNPWLPGGGKGGFFDELGFALTPLTLIENGILKNFAIDGKHAAHLGRKMTSALSNVEVQPGTTSLSDLREDGVVELVKFSTFTPNQVSGSFSGEIRLGYLYRNGKKMPIKGGSVSASGPGIFLDAIMSRETTQRESYFGPAGVYFPELTIAGEGA